MYIEGILERLNLTDSISPEGFKVLDGTIGEWLEHHEPVFYHFFVHLASGEYLDLHGRENGLIRFENESDEDFRKRILTEISIVDSTSDIENVGCRIWVYDEHIVDEENYLTSTNPCLKENSSPLFLFHADSVVEEYVKSKFIFGDDIVWF